MKLGIVSDEQFLAELKNGHADTDTPLPVVDPSIVSSNQVIEKRDGDSSGNESRDQGAKVVSKKIRGRSQGDVNVPENLRKLIGEESVLGGRESAIALAKDFGISPSSVSAYAVGATSTKTYHDPNKTLINYLQARKSRITKKSLRVLTNCLDELTPDRLKGIKARELSAIAKDMSTVTNNMSDKDGQSDGGNKPQFVIYAPQVRDERSYETIVVTDNF